MTVRLAEPEIPVQLRVDVPIPVVLVGKGLPGIGVPSRDVAARRGGKPRTVKCRVAEAWGLVWKRRDDPIDLRGVRGDRGKAPRLGRHSVEGARNPTTIGSLQLAQKFDAIEDIRHAGIGDADARIGRDRDAAGRDTGAADLRELAADRRRIVERIEVIAGTGAADMGISPRNTERNLAVWFPQEAQSA